jgi:hypothetical protein
MPRSPGSSSTRAKEGVVEAATIVAAQFAQRGELELAVNGLDAVKAAIAVRNNKLIWPKSTKVIVGYVFGIYDPATGQMSMVPFMRYIWGSAAIVELAAPGWEVGQWVETYCFNFSQPTTFDILAFVAHGRLGGPADNPAQDLLRTITVDWGSGERINGLNSDDFQVLSQIHGEIYQRQITVSPKP